MFEALALTTPLLAERVPMPVGQRVHWNKSPKPPVVAKESI